MYTYKNKITGAVITTYGKVTGPDWELVKATRKKPTESTADDSEENADE